MTTLAPRPAWTLAVADTAVMTRRYLYHYLRKPNLLGLALVQPVLFVLLWTYVFSGAIQTPGGIDYVDYLMPGLFILAIAFGSANTGVGLAEDLARGLLDRFRALPMARPALLLGRTLADTARNGFVVLLMVAVGYTVGFRFHAGMAPALAALAVPLAVGYLLSWISALIGLTVGDPETAGTASLLPVIPWPSPAPPSCPSPPCPAGCKPGPTATRSPMRWTPPAPWPSAAPPAVRCSGPSPGSWASWRSSSHWPSTATAASPSSLGPLPPALDQASVAPRTARAACSSTTLGRAPATLLAHCPVDPLAQQVGMAVVPGVLLHHVHQHPAQRHRPAPGIRDLPDDIEVGRRGHEPLRERNVGPPHVPCLRDNLGVGQHRRLITSWCGSGGAPRRCRNGVRPAARAPGGGCWEGTVCRLPR
jgi:ABC-2 type transporter